MCSPTMVGMAATEAGAAAMAEVIDEAMAARVGVVEEGVVEAEAAGAGVDGVDIWRKKGGTEKTTTKTVRNKM